MPQCDLCITSNNHYTYDCPKKKYTNKIVHDHNGNRFSYNMLNGQVKPAYLASKAPEPSSVQYQNRWDYDSNGNMVQNPNTHYRQYSSYWA